MRFYTATLAPDERLKSAGKGRVPPRTSLPSAGATRLQGGDHMQCFARAGETANILSQCLFSPHTVSVPLDPCSRGILHRSPSTPALGTYSIGPPRLGEKTNGFAFRAGLEVTSIIHPRSAPLLTLSHRLNPKSGSAQRSVCRSRGAYLYRGDVNLA